MTTLANSACFSYHNSASIDCAAESGDSPATVLLPRYPRNLSVTITRVGTNQKYAIGWDSAFTGKKPKAAAKKKASPKKKAAGKKKKK
jgi:hypothetical protein